MNDFKKTPFILSVVFLAILSSGFFFLYREVDSNNKKAEQATAEFENEISLRSEAKLLNDSIETVKEDGEKLGTHFAESSDIVPFLNTVEGLAKKVGATAEIASVDELKDGGGLIMKVQTSGSFRNIYKFLTLLENSQYELEFTDIDIQKESGSTPTPDPDPEPDAEGEVKEVPAPVLDSKWQAVFGIKLLSFIP